MQTQLMNDVPSTSYPWLEHFPGGAAEAEQTWIDSVPFTIGRNEEVELTIPSGRVSREHAQITCENGVYCVQDLGSTNGTYVNGAPVTQAELQDGDVVTIADVELTFYEAEEAAGDSALVTQVIGDDTVATQRSAGKKPAHIDHGKESILAFRRLHEQSLHCCFGCQFDPIVQLNGKVVFGYRAQLVEPEHAWTKVPNRLRSVECRSNERINEVFRLFAVEQSAELPSDALLFYRLESTEVGLRWLPEAINRAQLNAPHFQRFVVEIADSSVCDIPYFRSFLQQLREREILVCYADFAGSHAHVEDMRNVAPDFLSISPTLIRDIDRSSGGQRQLQDIVNACEDLNCQPIAGGVHTELVAEIVTELGCVYADGEFFHNA